MVRDVTGLYLNPPDKAVVLYVDEKSQVPGPGTDRYGAALPLVGHHDAVRRPGDRHRQGHRRLLPRHRHEEFLQFLRQVAKAYLRRQLHVVTDTAARTSTRT